MYSVVFHEDVDNDLKLIGHSSTLLVLKKLQQIAKNPLIGQELENKANMNLAGYKKVYVDKKKIRIVYKIIDKNVFILIEHQSSVDIKMAYRIKCYKSAIIEESINKKKLK